jgi:hypothetical protein
LDILVIKNNLGAEPSQGRRLRDERRCWENSANAQRATSRRLRGDAQLVDSLFTGVPRMSLSLPSNASRTVKSLRFSVTLRLWATNSKLQDALGDHFLRLESATAPVALNDAGSGVVPLIAMIRQRRVAQTVLTALLISGTERRVVRR